MRTNVGSWMYVLGSDNLVKTSSSTFSHNIFHRFRVNCEWTRMGSFRNIKIYFMRKTDFVVINWDVCDPVTLDKH